MEESSPERKLAAILIADAVQYSLRMAKDEERTLRALNTRRALIEQVVTNHRGHVFGGAGDSIVAEFPSAVEALRTAIEVQGAISRLNEDIPEADAMSFRMGINLGDVIVEGRNLFGDGVNIAERLQTLAAPGGICISSSVHEQVRDKVHVVYNDHGEQILKNIAHPVRAYFVSEQTGELSVPVLPHSRWKRFRFLALLTFAGILAALTITYLQFPQRQTLAPEIPGPPTLAVLPFANLSGEAKEDYFSAGMTRDIITALSRFSNLSVLSSEATAKYAGTMNHSAELRQELGVQYLVTGSVRRSLDRVRIIADLTDTGKKQLHLWSRQFDAEIDDIFTVQDEITREIVGALAIKLSRIEQDRAFARETHRPDAYDYFLRGRALLPAGNRADNMQAREYFEKAIAADPHYSAAIAWLGQTYLNEAMSGWTEFASDSVNRAEELGQQALKLSPDLAEGYQLLASADQAQGRYDLAIVNAKRAIEINPSDAFGYATLGTALMWSGNAKEAITALERARKFDPTLQWDWVSPLGFAYYLDGRYEQAINVLEPISKVSSDYGVYAVLAAAYAELGRASDASRAASEVKRLWPFFRTSQFAAQWKDDVSRAPIKNGLTKAGLD